VSIDNWRGEADWRFATHLAKGVKAAGSCGRTPFEAARQVPDSLLDMSILARRCNNNYNKNNNNNNNNNNNI
jgi:hypothetical protein